MNEETENQSKSQKEQPKPERRFSQEQYDMLKRCSAKGDITEWNQWRKQHPTDEVLLQEADLGHANLQKADFENANLQKAELGLANLQEAKLGIANLQEADLGHANLQKADLMFANLQEADLSGANLEEAYLVQANLQAADLSYVNLIKTNLMMATVDGSTLIAPLDFDRLTNFTGVGLDSARVKPDTRQLLEYNIRRMNWKKWYRGKSKKGSIIAMRLLVTSPTRLFWWISNYGLSTWRLILTFFVLATAFALGYWLWPSFVMVNGEVGGIRGLWHALYFSVVTMTTLGFGDIAANPDSWGGQALLMLQVILGYVLLGALVTRFAVLFTAGGPAGRFPRASDTINTKDKESKGSEDKA